MIFNIVPYKISISDGDRKFFQLIARQTLGNADAAWLSKNIQEGLNWNSIAEITFEEGLAPFLYYHSRNMGVLKNIPEGTKKFLARIYTETALLNLHLLKEVDELGRKLEQFNIQVIVFKGGDLLKTVYIDIALRPMEDIDLIVRQEHLGQLKDVLEMMRFVQNEQDPYSFSKGILSFDIHTDILSSHRIRSREEVMNISMTELWSRAVPMGNSISLYHLSFQDNLIALSFHLLKHRYHRRIGFVDIAETINAYQATLNWSEIIEYARNVRAEKILLYTFLLMKHLVGFDVPEYVLVALGKKRLTIIEKYLLRIRLIDVPLGMITDILFVLQVPGIFKKFRFIMENIIPRQEIMKQIYPSGRHEILTILRRTCFITSQFFFTFLTMINAARKEKLPPL
jgi:hypothetical protein